MLSSNMLLLNLILLIHVTFSTPTRFINNYHFAAGICACGGISVGLLQSPEALFQLQQP